MLLMLKMKYGSVFLLFKFVLYYLFSFLSSKSVAFVQDREGSDKSDKEAEAPPAEVEELTDEE